MRQRVCFILIMIMAFTMAFAQDKQHGPQITFKNVVHDFGQFSEDDPYVSCVFEFTNTGDAPLVIHRALASCGCTVPTFPKEPIMPGQKGHITVSYNGKNRTPAPFQKSIRIMTNANPEMAIIYIKGEMTENRITKEKTMLDR